MPERHLSEEAQALLCLIDRANALAAEITTFKRTVPSNENHLEKAASELRGFAGALRVKVGERVVADWTGTEPARKF